MLLPPWFDALHQTRYGTVRSILAAGHGITHPQAAGEALVIELPTTVTRSLADYALHAFSGDPS